MAHVGALLELSLTTPLKAVRVWMGVSAGSLMAMCFAIGYSLDEVYDISIRFDFTNVKEMDSVPGWILRFGLDTGERLHRLVEAVLHVRGFSSDLTFQELYDKTGMSLLVIATDLNDAVAMIYSPLTSPAYRVADAVRASMSAPYYFQPFLCPQTGHYLVDGAVISNYPLFVIPKEEHATTISILIRTNVETIHGDMMDMELDQLITRPLYIALREKATVEASLYDAHCIQIQLGEINILDFSFDEDMKQKIVEKGKDAVRQYLRGQGRITRRNSL